MFDSTELAAIVWAETVTRRGYETFTDEQRQAVVAAYPRGKDFGNKIIDAFYHGFEASACEHIRHLQR